MILFYILLGIVQGVLEWLPVSSEGNLVLITLWMNDFSAEDALSLAFWLHLGTMFAVLVVYRDDWRKILDIRRSDTEGIRSFLVLTTIGTAIVGIPIKIFFIDSLNVHSVSLIVMWVIAISLIITGFLLHYSRKEGQIGFSGEIKDLSKRQQLLLGFAQGFTIIPGISRSGTSISVLIFAKQNTESAFKGSFLMSVPASLGAVTLDIFFSLIEGEPLIGGLDPLGIFVAILMAFIFGIITMQALITVARKYNFSIIVITLGLIVIIFLLFSN